MKVTAINDVVGKVIVNSDNLYVKVLATPRLERYELVPGWYVDRWEALAQVNESLCIVELSIQEGSS